MAKRKGMTEKNGYLVTVDGKNFRGSSAILNRLVANVAYRNRIDMVAENFASFSGNIAWKHENPKALRVRDECYCDENCDCQVYDLK